MNQIQKYTAIFGRPPYLVSELSSDRGIQAAFFPKIEARFFKRLMSEACDQNIYITAGLSNYEMSAPQNLGHKPEKRIELVAQTEGQITGGESGKEDIVSLLLEMISDYIIENSIFIEPGHTLDFEENLTTNSEMTGFLFAVPEGIDVNRICKACRPCQGLVSLIPISEEEIKFARDEGVWELIDKFEESGVIPVFDPFRKSVL